jgi:lysyl-tRNA synthetase class II
MILTGAKSIRDVILFPLLKPQSSEQNAEEK